MPKTKQFDEEEVLKKANEVFGIKGYNGTSMEDLVQVTGLSRSSIYDTFGDKHGLFLRTLDKYQCDEQLSLRKTIEKTGSPRKKIILAFNKIVQDILTDDKKRGCLLLNASMELSCVDPKVAGKASSGMEEMEELFHKWIKEGQSKGEISKKFSAKSLARHLYNCYAGLRITGRNRPDAAILKDIVKVSLAILEP